MKRMRFVLFLCIVSLIIANKVAGKNVSVLNVDSNNIEEVKIKLDDIWGEDEEIKDKYFQLPSAIAFDQEDNVYVCDQYQHCIFVYSYEGDYIKTIGKQGQGPGDLFMPVEIAISSTGDILVWEMGNKRIQMFDKSGISKKIIRSKQFIRWIAFSSSGDIYIHDKKQAYSTEKLLEVFSENFKIKFAFGSLSCKSVNQFFIESYNFAKDKEGNLYIANTWLPLIRKYDANGSIVKIWKYPSRQQIKPDLFIDKSQTVLKIENGYDLNDLSPTTGAPEFSVSSGFSIDNRGYMFLIRNIRNMTNEEKNYLGTIGGGRGNIARKGVNWDKLENILIKEIVVLNQNGIEVGQKELPGCFSEKLYVRNNKIFINDGYINQRILVYTFN